MAKKNEIIVKDVVIMTIKKDGRLYPHYRYCPSEEHYWAEIRPLIIGELTIHHLNQLLYTEDGMYALGKNWTYPTIQKPNNHYALGLYGLSESLQAKSVALIS